MCTIDAPQSLRGALLLAATIWQHQVPSYPVPFGVSSPGDMSNRNTRWEQKETRPRGACFQPQAGPKTKPHVPTPHFARFLRPQAHAGAVSRKGQSKGRAQLRVTACSEPWDFAGLLPVPSPTAPRGSSPASCSSEGTEVPQGPGSCCGAPGATSLPGGDDNKGGALSPACHLTRVEQLKRGQQLATNPGAAAEGNGPEALG